MDIKVDDFGRIVIPKKIRDRLGIQSGSKLRLDIEEHNQQERIALEPVRTEDVLQRRGELLVHTGALTEDATDVLKHVRDERTRKLMGL